MGFWIFMLIMDLLIPFTMIGFGKMFLKKAPDQINYVFGYRTSMSMKNQDTWVFAHHYCGKIWYICGLILLVVSLIVLLLVIGKSNDAIGNVGGILCVFQMELKDVNIACNLNLDMGDFFLFLRYIP